MSGPGDIDGEVSGDEAAWRDLVARFESPAEQALTEVPWPAREDLPRPVAGGAGSPGPGSASSDLAGPPAGAADPPVTPAQRGGAPGGLVPNPPAVRPRGGPGGYVPADHTRVIRSAGDPRSYSPADDEEQEDERYIPTPLPPPARLDPASKAALAGVIGGPGYLLVVSVFLHWTISAAAAFIAVAAFIGGFVTLVVKLGDRPRRDDDDDGAVV